MQQLLLHDYQTGGLKETESWQTFKDREETKSHTEKVSQVKKKPPLLRRLFSLRDRLAPITGLFCLVFYCINSFINCQVVGVKNG